MDPMTAVMLGSAGAGLLSQWYGQKKQDDFAKESLAFQKEQAEKQYKEQRRAALRSILGADIGTMPQKQDVAPQAPSMMGPMIGQGLANLVGQYAALRGANSQQFNPYSAGAK